MILERSNRISETVKLTLEWEKNNSLPFLDVKIMRQNDKLNSSVYGKVTDPGRYLYFKSNHPRSVKVSVASCLMQGTETPCNEEQEKQKEILHVKSTLKNNGDPKNVFGEIEKKRARREQAKEKEFMDVMVIPHGGRSVRSH
jgi:hypothetical protein